MIQDAQELAASLEYAAKWADTLEGLRRHAQETDAALLATTSAGPLSEIRRVLAEAREFVSRLDQETVADHSPCGGERTGKSGLRNVSRKAAYSVPLKD
jgi:hypothetical protein